MIFQLSVLLLGFVTFTSPNNLPSTIKTCNRSDPQVAKCLSDAIEKALVSLKLGIPSLNFSSIEPMKIGNVIVEQSGATSTFNLKSSFKNAEIHGLSSSKILRTAVQYQKFLIKSEAFSDRLDFIGQYTMNGQILVLPIRGDGFANVSMQHMTTRHELKADYFIGPDGNKYLNVTDYKIKFKPKRVIFRYENLFNGDELLGRTMNNFMNDNWEPVFEGIIPGYEVKLGEKFRKVANSLFHKVPFEKIFPD